MTASILERIRNALVCPVEHPVPVEIFSSLTPYNPLTMEIVSKITDDEIRLIRLMNELRDEAKRLGLEVGRNVQAGKEDLSLDFRYMTSKEDLGHIENLMLLSVIERHGEQMRGRYTMTSNGKIARMRDPNTVAH